MQDHLFKKEGNITNKNNGFLAQLPNVIPDMFNATKEKMIPTKIKLKPFIGKDLYLDLIYKVVDFNDGIELTNNSTLDSL